MRRRALLLLAAVATPLAARAQSDWQTVVGRDLRFRLEMPAPAQESKAGEKEKGHASQRIAWHSSRDGDMFDFDYVDYEIYNSWVTMDNRVGGVTVDLGAGTTTGTWGNDTFVSIEGAVGSYYEDLLIGSNSGDYLNGSLGNDVLVGNAGDDSIDGGDGLDSLVYAGVRSDYFISGDADMRIVVDDFGGDDIPF